MEPIYVTSADRPDLGGNMHGGDGGCFTPDLWRYLVDRYGIKTVLDVGCGQGHAVAFFNRIGTHAHGIDGLPKNIENSVAPIALHDLTRGAYIMPVDMVVCVEVVEHVEERFLPFLLETLSNGKIVAMTHAVPGQDGHHHVNCQPSSYWIAHLDRLGYSLSPDNEIFRKIADSELGYKYFSDSGLVFLRRPTESR